MSLANALHPVVEKILRIQESWGLSDRQMSALLHVSPMFFERAKATLDDGSTLPAGLETAGSVITVFSRLGVKLEKPELQAKWLMSDNPDFGGNRPLDIAAQSPENLNWLAYYLDSVSLLQ